MLLLFYQIFAVFRTSGTWGVGYPYHMFNDTNSEEAFNQFIANVKGAEAAAIAEKLIP